MKPFEAIVCLLLLCCCCCGDQTLARRREGKNSVSRTTDLVHSSVSARRSRQLRQKFHPHGVPSEQLHFGMLSRDEVIVKERGENVELACEFNLEYYHAFDNPVIWLKSQVSEAKIKINSMAVIEEPFLGTRRFSVGWHKQPPRYWFTLTVKDLKVEDTGNYTCEIRGKKSSIIMDVVKTLIVRDHIRIVQLILRSHENSLPHDLPSSPESSDDPLLSAHEAIQPPQKLHREPQIPDTGKPFQVKEDRPTIVVTIMNNVENHLIKQDSILPDQYETIEDLPSHHQPKLENEINFFETETSLESSNFSSKWLGSPGKQRDLQTNAVVDSGDSSSFECLIVGGFPQPLVEIFVGGRNLTSSFQSQSNVKLLGDRGFKRLDLETSLRPRKTVTLSHEDHNQDLACKARSSHTSNYLAARLKLQVNHKPVVTCTPISARIDDVNVCLRCEVIGRPAPAIFWTLDEHPVVMDTRNSGYWSLVRDKSDGMFETSLCIGRTVPDVFRTYDLVAENNFGRSSGRIDLILNVTRRSKDVFSDNFEDSMKQTSQQKPSTMESDRPSSHNSTHWTSHKTNTNSVPQINLETVLWCSVVVVSVRTVYDLKFRSFN